MSEAYYDAVRGHPNILRYWRCKTPLTRESITGAPYGSTSAAPVKAASLLANPHDVAGEGALNFSGQSTHAWNAGSVDKVSVEFLAKLEDFSEGLLVALDSFQVQYTTPPGGSGVAGLYLVHVAADKLVTYVGPLSVALNVTYHILIDFDGSKNPNERMRFWVDNALVGVGRPGYGDQVVSSLNPSQVYMGNQGPILDEISVTGAVFSDEERTWRYKLAKGITVPDGTSGDYPSPLPYTRKRAAVARMQQLPANVNVASGGADARQNFSSALFNQGGLTVPGDGRIVIPSGQGGLYLLNAVLGFDQAPAGRITARMRVNGVPVAGWRFDTDQAFDPWNCLTTPWPLAPGDEVDLVIANLSGVAEPFLVASRLNVALLGPYLASQPPGDQQSDELPSPLIDPILKYARIYGTTVEAIDGSTRDFIDYSVARHDTYGGADLTNDAIKADVPGLWLVGGHFRYTSTGGGADDRLEVAVMTTSDGGAKGSVQLSDDHGPDGILSVCAPIYLDAADYFRMSLLAHPTWNVSSVAGSAGDASVHEMWAVCLGQGRG